MEGLIFGIFLNGEISTFFPKIKWITLDIKKSGKIRKNKMIQKKGVVA